MKELIESLLIGCVITINFIIDTLTRYLEELQGVEIGKTV